MSILDPKTPLAHMLAGAAVAIGRGVGADDLDAIRIGFFILACLTVVAVFLAAAFLFNSTGAGLVASATFLTFKGFAIDALGGPNAKTPAILFGILATALLFRRQYFWGALAASLASLVWQPMAIYALVAITVAWLGSDRADRLRRMVQAVLGASIPVAATALYFVVSGAFDELYEFAVLLPLTGIDRGDTPFAQHMRHLVATVHETYGPSAWVLWSGMALLVGLVVLRVWQHRSQPGSLRSDPLVTIVSPPLVFLIAFSLVDFQGYPDAYPLLPYAALGWAGAVSAGLGTLERGPAWAQRAFAPIVALAVVVVTWVWYSGPRPESTLLVMQRADAAAAARMLGPSSTVYSFGDPTPLVLMRRASPSPAIFLSSGVDRWIVEHTPGGFHGWTSEVAADNPDMVIIGGWGGDYNGRMRQWLGERYVLVRIGELRAFVSPALGDRADG